MSGRTLPEGFVGGDRTSIDLPKDEEALVEAVKAAGKPLVVVLMNGSALGVNWAQPERQRHPGSLVSGRRGRYGDRRDAGRREQPRRAACP